MCQSKEGIRCSWNICGDYNPKFPATILMSRDIFARVQSLNLALHKSGESLVLADIAVYLDKTMSFLEKLKSVNRRLFFTKPNFNNFNFSKKAMASLLTSSCTQ